MLTVKQLKASTRSGPYCQPLRARVLAVGPSKNYTPAGATEAKSMAYVSLGQDSAWVKVTVYNEEKLAALHTGSSVMLKNYVFRNGSLMINERTVIGKTADVAVDFQTQQAAYQAIYPPSVMADVAELLAATGPTLWSLRAVITKLLCPQCLLPHLFLKRCHGWIPHLDPNCNRSSLDDKTLTQSVVSLSTEFVTILMLNSTFVAVYSSALIE